MKQLVYRSLRLSPVIIFVAIFISGCVSSYNIGNIGLIEPGKSSAKQELYIDKYKMQVRVIPIADDHQYICSMSLSYKDDLASIKDLKSNMDIKKYSSRSMPRGGIQRVKQVIINDIEPIRDSLSNYFDYKYKLKSKGKYELIIRLTEINAKELEKEILVSFDQEVK